MVPENEVSGNLHPDHLADLRKSGLSDATIAWAGLYSVRPGDIGKITAISGVTSLLAIPYDADFTRYKVFPPTLKGRNGAVRYLQPKRSGCHLYIPPLLAPLLADPALPLAIVEGEKKALKACQEGLPCVAIGGLWNWIKDGHLLPDFDRLVLADRLIRLYPNSDVWERQDLLPAIYRLGAALEAKGASVRVVRIPAGVGKTKQGLDDFLVAYTADDSRQLRQFPLTDPVFAAARAKAEGHSWVNGDGRPCQPLTLTRLGDLLSEPDDALEWLLDGILPAGGFSLLTAKPKVGKSTLARCLALAVAQGKPFLGRSTPQGAVIYLALEEKRAEVRKHFKAMGATGDEELYIYAATAPADALEQIRAIVQEKKPVLLIIDPLFRLTRVKDGNDYAQVTQALEPLLALARETGCHVLCVHHLGKGDRQGGDAILGSTAIFAAVDTAIILKRHERYRTISSVQRYGEDLEETTLRYDPESRMISLGEPKDRQDEAVIAAAILEHLGAKGEAITEAEIDAEVEGKTKHKRAALRSLVKDGRVERTGRGGKGDPFRYSLCRANPTRNTDPPGESRANTGDDRPASNVVPLFPYIYREQENKNPESHVNSEKDLEYSYSDDSQNPLNRAAISNHRGNRNSDQPSPCCPTCGGQDFEDVFGRSVCLDCLKRGDDERT